jgi:hypothetical protein
MNLDILVGRPTLIDPHISPNIQRLVGQPKQAGTGNLGSSSSDFS